MFSKQTSTAVSSWGVNAIFVSPATSLGRPYSLPSVSRIYPSTPRPRRRREYVDVDALAIASVSADGCSDDDEDVAVDIVADAPWLHMLRVLRWQLKAQRLRGPREEQEKERKEEGQRGLHRKLDGTGRTQAREHGMDATCIVKK